MTIINPHGTKYCPNCGKPSTVKDSRITAEGRVRRRRVCECGHRYSTVEFHAEDPTLALMEMTKDVHDSILDISHIVVKLLQRTKPV